MTQFEQDLTIEELIKASEKEHIWLPEFQRPFVWDYNQIRLLVDSLFNNYTISSILLWKGANELARRRIGGSIQEIKAPKINDSQEITYLLDGQQRATTLTLCFTNKQVFIGSNTKKFELINLYWDSEYTGDDPERRWVFDDEPIFSDTDNDTNIYLRDYSEDQIFSMFAERFVKLKHVYYWGSVSSDIAVKMGANTSLFVKYMNKVLELQRNTLHRKVYKIEQKGTLEQVLEVFERINTKNTKLSIFDIMVAKTYKKIGANFFILREYLKLLNFKKNITSNYFENIKKTDLSDVKYSIPESEMLFIIMILLKKDFKATGILKIKTEDLMKNVKMLHDKYIFLVDYMGKHFNIESSELKHFQPMMKFLAAAVAQFPKINLTEQEFLRKWFWLTLLKNRYPGAQNERIEKDYKIICKHSLNDALEIMVRDCTRNFSAIHNAKPTAPRYFEASYAAKTQQIYRGLMLLLKSNGAKDFYSGLTPTKSGATALSLDEHHIFPVNSKIGKLIVKNYAGTSNSDIINNVANLALITNEANRKRIREKNPSVYITQFEDEYIKAGKQKEFLEIMKSQFISPKMILLLKDDKFEEFIYERTMLIEKQIEKLCS